MTTNMKRAWIGLIVVVLFICLGMEMCNKPKARPSYAPAGSGGTYYTPGKDTGSGGGGVSDDVKEMGAVLVCRDYAAGRLKAPSTAKFQRSSDAVVTRLGVNKYRVKSYVDAENSFGAMIRTTYLCAVTLNGEMWTLNSLETSP